MVPGQGSHGPDGLVPRLRSSADQLRTHVGRGVAAAARALGRRPGLETLLLVLILLAVVRPSDVRSGGTGRLQAGWRTRPHPSRGVGPRSGTAPGMAPAEYLGSRGSLGAVDRCQPCNSATGGQGLNPGPFLCLHRDRSNPTSETNVANGTEGMRQEPRVQIHTTPVPHTPHDPGSCLYLHTHTHTEKTRHT